ncbi:oxygenase MpaB family protein [Actinocrispum sp. NPDC049592]|uniref:oxygenase MpaB family protein n=1 Tax=Actinocrispum sp. NPDC049592 TaxID=3154835 RepID=UPI003434CC20
MAVLGPGSVAWRTALDWRLLLGSGRALLLQVAHPTVGAGVAQYSNYRAEPWQRLQRTVDSMMLQTFGGERAAAEARRLRELHRGFTGVDHHGNRYSALNPDAYWWVHATLFEGALDVHRNFGTPLPVSVQREYYAEWRSLGELLGIKPHRMPVTLEGFWDYFSGMVVNHLEDNKSVRDLLDALGERHPLQPPWWPLPSAMWRAAGPIGARTMMTATVGTLPPVFRERLGLQWTRWDERRLDVLKKAVRVAMPMVPVRYRYHPMALAARLAS